MNETAIKDALQYWLENSMGTPHVFTIDFDIDFEAGNLIDGTFTGLLADPITQVPFTNTHAETLEALRAEIQMNVNVFKARITGARQITCTGTPNGQTIAVTGPTVTGGVNQAVATVVTVTPAVKVTVIDEDENTALDNTDTERPAPRPDYPYATLKVESLVAWSTDDFRGTDDDGITSMGGQRRATVSVNFYGKDPMGEIAKAINGLGKETINDVFRAAGFAVWQKNSGQNLTGMLETKNEPRAYFDFYIGLAENYEDDTGLIEEVDNLTGTIDGLTVGPMTIKKGP